MELAEEFRLRAQRCLKLAQNAPTLEAQTHWLAMAELWLNVAHHAEEQDALLLGQAQSREGKNNDQKDCSDDGSQGKR